MNDSDDSVPETSRWLALGAKLRPVADLVPYARNARTHSAEQIDQLAALIARFGWTDPVLVDETGGIIAGHGRIMAAQRLGMAEVPVIVAEGWTADEKRAFILAHNQVAARAGWDDALLSAEIAALEDAGIDGALLGFDLPDAPDDAKTPAAPTIYEVPTGPVEDRFWITVRGPLVDQPSALQRLREAMEHLTDVDVQLGTVQRDGDDAA